MTTRTRAFTLTLVSAVLFAASLFWAQQLENRGDNAIPFQLVSTAVLFLVLSTGTLWVLFFKHQESSFVTVGLFPAIAAVPYILFAYRVMGSIFAALEGVALTLVATLGFALLVYLLVLTANILNGSILYGIPLGQAGKAAQFIFSLVAMYFLSAFLLGTETFIVIRMVLVAALSFYLTYSAVWCLQVTRPEQINRVATVTAIILALFTAVMSVWPISTIYATVVITALFYMILNVALELREQIRGAIWFEYLAVVILIIFVLVLLGEWGINGALI
jgi:hypothetical protein